MALQWRGAPSAIKQTYCSNVPFTAVAFHGDDQVNDHPACSRTWHARREPLHKPKALLGRPGLGVQTNIQQVGDGRGRRAERGPSKKRGLTEATGPNEHTRCSLQHTKGLSPNLRGGPWGPGARGGIRESTCVIHSIQDGGRLHTHQPLVEEGSMGP